MRAGIKKFISKYPIYFLLFLPAAIAFNSCGHRFDKHYSAKLSNSSDSSDTAFKEHSKDISDSCITLDSANVNSPNEYYGSHGYYKTGDSLKWSNDTNTSNWQKPARGAYNVNIWFMVPVKVRPSLLNRPLCLKYEFEAAFEIYVNGKLITGMGKVSTSKAGEIIKYANDYAYITFTKPVNYITIRASNHYRRNDHTNFPFQIYSGEYHKRILKSKADNDAISIALSIFFFAFFFIYMNLFFSDRKNKTNLYFSLFCFFIFLIFLITTSLVESENYKINSLLFAFYLMDATFLFYTFLCFLHQLVLGKLSNYLRWVFAACILLAIGVISVTFYINVIVYVICSIGTFFIGLFATIDAIRVVIIGYKNKTKGIKPIVRGIFISMMLSIVSLIISYIPGIKQFSFFSWAVSLSVIPVSVAITLVNNYTKTSRQLAIELANVSALSEKTIKQEKEKQQILETQNEKLEEKVIIRTAEVVKQKNEAEKQKLLVEEKQKEILDSITYAKRLQDAILPPITLIKQYFPESFVLYKPKDIVAGDFYWMERAGDVILIAAADCTGHGVPGALVSVVCSNALNRTVKEFRITEPGKILDKVRELVLETFDKSKSNIQDGMDISLCCINPGTHEIKWSGAYNPLWYIHKGQMLEVKADKQPIGKYDKPSPFSTHTLALQKGDPLYLFTDGYADQFGGEKGKKFKYKQLQEFLLANSSEPMAVQMQALNNMLEKWKGNLEQVDDVLLIGIRV